MAGQQEQALVDGARRDDRRARDLLVASSLPAVRSIARRYRGLGLPVEDLVQEGSVGLLEAIDNYDAGRGAAFDPYARNRISGAIRNALAAAAGPAVEAIRSLGALPVSLDQPVLADGSTLEGLVVDRSAPDPEAETVQHEQLREVDDAVGALSPRQREIVRRHYGLGREPEQIAAVAAALHVSQQRVRAIERDALYALRDRLTREPTSANP